MDIGCMIDIEWLDSLENDGKANENVRSKEDLIADFIIFSAEYPHF